MADKKISQLDSASSVSSGAYFPISQSGTTYKGTTDQIGEQIATNQDFSELNTTSKKIVGAINEVLTTSNIDILTTIDTPAPIMTFNDGGDNIPVNKLLVAVTAQQAGSGTPSPSNPRAITGWSQAQISVSDGVTPTTVIIPFGDTYYGCVLDVTNGKLTVTHGILDMGDVNWTRVQVDTYYVFYYVASDKAENYNFICSCYNAVEKVRSNLSDLEMGTYNSTNGMNRFTVRDDSYTDSNTFQTAMTGQKIVYELATPIVINLTPEQITTLSGLNNIYADCGDIQLLEYFNENANEVAELNRAMSDDYHVYSTAEQIVGKWLGEDLYEKSYHYTQATCPAQGVAVVIDNAIANLNLASLVDMACVYKTHHTSQNYDVWYHGGLSNTQLDYSTGNLLFYQKATSQQQNYNNLEVNIIIRYTKSA